MAKADSSHIEYIVSVSICGAGTGDLSLARKLPKNVSSQPVCVHVSSVNG